MRKIKTITGACLAASLVAGTAVGVAAQDDEPPPVSSGFTGRFTTQDDPLPHADDPVAVHTDGLETSEFAFQGSVVSSDPRMTGTFVFNHLALVDTRSDLNFEQGSDIGRKWRPQGDSNP